MRKTRIKAAAMVTAAILCAACGPPPTTLRPDASEQSPAVAAFEQFDEMPANQRTQALIEAAKEEGQVVAYLRADTKAAELERAFEGKYGIDLKLVNPGTATVVRQQVLEQARAGRLEADIIESYPYELKLVYGESGITTRLPDYLKGTVSSPDLATDYSLETFQYPFLPAWNTNQISATDAPRSWQDFTKPQFAGRLGMVKNWEIWYMTVFDYLTGHGMSPTEFADLFRQLARNASTTESANPAGAFLASGQFRAVLNISLTSAQKIGPTAPIAWEPAITPVVLSPLGIGLTRTAPHPAAALLFAEWYVTEGQPIVEQEQFVEQSPNEHDLKDAVKVRPDVKDLTVDQFQQWRNAYENLITGKDDVLPEYVKAQ